MHSYESKGRGFESRRAYQKENPVNADKYGIHGIFAITVSIQISSAKTAKNHSIPQKGVAEVWQKLRTINSEKAVGLFRLLSYCLSNRICINDRKGRQIS